MLNLLEKIAERGIQKVLVKDGKICLPLELDTAIYEEYLKKPSDLIKEEKKILIPTISIKSIVDNIPFSNPNLFYELERIVKREILPDFYSIKVNLHPLLEELLVEVAPIFIGLDTTKDASSNKLKRILKAIKEKYGYSAPPQFIRKAKAILDPKGLLRYEKIISSVDSGQDAVIKDGVYRLLDLNSKISEVVKERILRDMKEKLEERIALIKKKRESELEEIALLLYLNSRNKIILGDFGIIRKDNGFIVYKETGPYALQDFDGRLYKFPSAQVAVKIYLDSRLSDPFVLNYYKHPFLPYLGIRQEICIVSRRYYSPNSLSRNVISRIYAGINTLLYGYFNRSEFKGYNLLHYSIKKRGRVTFRDYLVSAEELEKSGIPVTNKHLIR